MSIKKYESLFHEDYLQLTLASGRVIKVAFKGGGEYPKPHGGCFVTDDQNIQDALEARRDFNQKFKIILNVPSKGEIKPLTPKIPPKIDLEPDKKELAPPALPENPATEPEQEAETEPATEPEQQAKSDEEPATEQKAILDVVNFQQVRNYLCKNYPGTTFADVRSKESAKKFAIEKKISFPNWVE
jgi:hypothetical protein